MKTFKLDQNGDVVIENNQIQLVEDAELIAQTVQAVLNTNIGEWYGDLEEGIDFSVILTKNANYDLIQDTINTAVQKVAESLNVTLETSGFNYNVEGRNLYITFTMTLNESESTEIEIAL